MEHSQNGKKITAIIHISEETTLNYFYRIPYGFQVPSKYAAPALREPGPVLSHINSSVIQTSSIALSRTIAHHSTEALKFTDFSSWAECLVTRTSGQRGHS
jgi:hypothetical protein